MTASRAPECRRLRALPGAPGTYVLVLRAPRAMRVRIGRRGTMRVEPGFYAYVGSALGPGGLAARLAHHLATRVAPRWHVDYLRAHTAPHAVWYTRGSRRREHEWARALIELPGAKVPLPRFGASDCRCRTHLVALPVLPAPSAFWGSLLRLSGTDRERRTGRRIAV